MTIKENIKRRIKSLPKKLGVYQYFDQYNKLIYVGKAKDIQKRVRSYYSTTHKNAKTKMLVKKIRDIKYFIVSTEMDALLLENNLIKKHQPKYNVLLKDDKTYPWICIKNESFPRVFLTRNFINDGSEYFGPYTSVKLVKTLLDLIYSLYPLRNCSYNLSQKNISSGKFELCLEFHIGNCMGPCESLQEEEDYLLDIQNVRKILKGNIYSVIKLLKKKIKKNADNLKFEEAQLLKEKLVLLESYQSKSTIVNPKIDNVDVFSIVSEAHFAYINYLKISNGAIVQTHTIEVKKRLEESDTDLLEIVITDLRKRFESISEKIYCSLSLKNFWTKGEIIVPKKGEKYKLIELSKRNAQHMRIDRINRNLNYRKNKKQIKLLSKIQHDFKLSNIPYHIECFDNSNLHGTNAVASCVVFRDCMPSKKEYRHFNIKTVKGSNDFASMEEVVYRRYSKLLKESKSLPQLIVIDGGKGQLSAAFKSLKALGVSRNIQIISIAKRLEEIFFYDDKYPLYLDKRSESLRLIQNLRDEAHRFSLTHHRNKRSKDSIKSFLDDIKGVGIKTRSKLLSHFGSLKHIKRSDKDEVSKIIGKKKSDILFKSINQIK